ncbi:katanin p80 WD40 repeat-containing subunit B1 homolog KTN80.1-like [Bidens hawaiensis]|uniref:katanin p80 WD40 repeat-containing subunit B1 homolog KTN80.1-like n=1 Tax=Bidens hawaiensis TaxID=980011 RepID=UPI00404933A2
MDGAKDVTTPLSASDPLSPADPSPLVDTTPYLKLVGSLQYLAFTRPDISFAINKLSQFMHNPRQAHWQSLKRVLRYLKGTIHHGLFLNCNSSLTLSAFSDSDWGGVNDAGRSTTAYILYLGTNIISWKSTRQKSVSRSSTEAEYKALANASAEITWTKNLLTELGILINQTPTLFCDNTGATYLSANPVYHSHMKHIALGYHFVREQVSAGHVRVLHISSQDQLADMLTKPLSRGLFLQEFAAAHSANVNCIKIGKKTRRHFVTGGDDQIVNLWSIGKPTPLTSLSGHTSPIESVAFDSTEVLVAAGASSGVVQLWDLEETKVVRTLNGHRSYCTAVEFHPFGEFLASGSMDTNLKIWDTRKKTCIHTYKSHKRAISTIRFTPDGRWVVSGGLDNIVKIWDITAGKLLHEFKFHEGHIRSMDFHPLEFLLATGSSDKTVKFWDLETFELIGSTWPEATGVQSITFHPDGRTLFCGLDSSLKVFSWQPVVCHDAVDLEWSTLGDICINDGKLLGCSYYQNSVGIWAADVSQIEPYKAQLKYLDNDTKDIKNIYVDTAGVTTVISKDVSADSNKEFQSVKYVNGVAVMNGRTRSLVEKFEKRDKLDDTNECHKPDLTSQTLPNTNNVPTTITQQHSNNKPVTVPDVVQQPMTETKRSKKSLKTPDLVVQTPKKSPNSVRQKAKASPIQKTVTSRRVIPEKTRSSMLVTRRSRAMKEDNPQTTGRDLMVKNENDNNPAEVLMLDHDSCLSTLRSRLAKLQVVRRFCDQNDPRAAINALQKLPDHAVQADVISVMLENIESVTLDLFSCLLPLLSGLLDSQTERHINVSLQMLLKLVAVFGAVINSMISASPTIGVDLHAEKQLESCNQCHILLQKVHKNLPDVIRRGGLTGKTAQELNRILQQS